MAALSNYTTVTTSTQSFVYGNEIVSNSSSTVRGGPAGAWSALAYAYAHDQARSSVSRNSMQGVLISNADAINDVAYTFENDVAAWSRSCSATAP